MKKRILSMLLAIVMMIGLLPTTIFAAESAASNEVHYAVVYDKTDDKIYLYLGNSAHVVADDEVVQHECQGYFTGERGDSYGLNFNIVKVIIESPIAPTSCKRLFAGLTNCTVIEGIEKLDTSRATSMEDMFASCFKLYNPDVSGFDTSKVTDMSGMFTSCYAISKLDLSNFDTSKVTDMSNMFASCRGLATELNLSSFIIGENTNTENMFVYCNPVNTIKTPKINEKADIELPKGNYAPYALYGSEAGTEGSNMMPVTDGASITIGRQVIATLDNNGIEIPEMPETKTVFLGIPYGELPTTNETKEGYTFYWTTELSVNQGANLISNDTKVVNAINHTIYACWEPNRYTVTVDANYGNTAPTTIEVRYNGYYYNLPKVTREGHTFIGWYTKAEGGDKINTSNCTIAANHTIYAHWVASCTVSFDANGGNVDPASMTVVPGETYGTLPNPTRTGYNFVGWYTAKSGGDKVTESTTVTETKDHTLYAQWEADTYWIYLYKNYTNSDTSFDVSMTVTHGKTYGENTWRNGYLPKPNRTGYNFVGWFTAREGGTQITANSIVTGSDDLYAHWEIAPFTVSFYDLKDGRGTLLHRQEVLPGEYATRPADPVTPVDPAKEGWIFAGWYANGAFTTEFDFNSPITGNVGVYAKWTEVHTHSYTYTASGNVITEACTCGHEKTATINAPSNLIYDGTEKVATVAYSEGWLGGELTVSYEPGNVEAGAVTASITKDDATATVAFTIEKSTYTVTFITNGGSISEDEVISDYTYGVGATLPIPTREGYTFLGWYAEEECSGEAVTAIGATDTGDKTFYAKWEETVERYDVWVGGVQVTGANKDDLVKAINDAANASVASGTATFDPATSTLALNNFCYTGKGYGSDYSMYEGDIAAVIYSDDALNILIEGDSVITHVNSDYYDISCGIASPMEITIADAPANGIGTLTVTGGTDCTTSAGLFSLAKVTIAGGIVTATGDDAFYTSTGILSYWDNITISGGEVTACGQNSETYSTGLIALGDITISGATVNATAGDAVYESVGIYAFGGDITISGGTVTASGYLSGIGSRVVTIGAGADVTASGHESGIYGDSITIEAGATVIAEYATTGDDYYGAFAETPTLNGTFIVYAGTADANEPADASADATYANKYVKIVPAYTVTYMVGEDEVYTEKVEPGKDVVNVPTLPTREGYTVTWSADGKNITANTTINAVYTPNQYTITFDSDGGSAVDPITQDYGTVVEAPAMPTKEGYTFAGWDAIPMTMPAENLTIKANWIINKYTVTYIADGEVVDTVEVEHGKDATAPEIPAKTGYTAAWDKDGKNITADTEINAVYTVNKYTVSYKADGQVVDTVEVEHGQDATAPEIPAKAGHTALWDKDGKNITADTEINAVYTINKYTVTYKADGEVVDTVEVEHGKDATAPEIPAKAGHTALWDKDGKNITADTEINAVYTINKYTVTYKADGEVVDTVEVEHGKDATAPEIPAKAGHTALWDKDGKNITADTEINAVYTVKKYTVTYKADGKVVKTVEVEHGKDATAPEIPTKEGYTAAWDKDGKNITADTEINAVYTINKYTVTYKADGEVVDTVEVEHGKDATAPEIPGKAGHTAAWDKDGKNITADTEINAVYTINKYIVTYKADGEVVDTVEVEHGKDATAPEIPGKEGYNETAPKWDKDGKNITADTEINAVYTKNQPGEYADVTPDTNVGGGKVAEEIEELKEKVPFTQEEEKQIEYGADVEVWLEIKDISDSVSSEEKAKVEEKLGDADVALYLDIAMFKQVGENEASRLTQLGDKVQITFKLADSLINTDKDVTRTYSIIHVHDGKAEVITPVFDAATKTLTFETDRFSTYAVVYTDVENVPPTEETTPPTQETTPPTEETVPPTEKPAPPADTPATGDSFQPAFWIACMTLSIFGIAVLLLDAKRRHAR